MTDERRIEMRRYRDLAVARELELSKQRIIAKQSASGTSSGLMKNDGSVAASAAEDEYTVLNSKSKEDTTTNSEGLAEAVPRLPIDTPPECLRVPSESLRVPFDQSELSFQSCTSKPAVPSGYASSDDSTFRSIPILDYSSTMTNRNDDDETTDSSLTYRPPFSHTATDNDEYFADISVKSPQSNHNITVAPIPGVASDQSSSSPRPRLIRSNSYTLDEPSPAFLRHLEMQRLHSAAQLTSDEKQDDECNEKTAARQADLPSVAERRKSLDATSNTIGKKAKLAAFKKTTAAIGQTAARRSSRPAFERVYAAKGSMMAVKPKSGSTNQRRAAVVIKGLAVEGQKVQTIEVREHF